MTAPVIARFCAPVLPIGPPMAQAEAFASECDPGAAFTILRRVRAGPRHRWEATEWWVRAPAEVPRSLHDHMGRHACLVRATFAFTAPGALRRLARCPFIGYAVIDLDLP